MEEDFPLELTLSIWNANYTRLEVSPVTLGAGGFFS